MLIAIENIETRAIVDDEDFEHVSKYKWFHNKGSGEGSIHTVKRSGKVHYSMANIVMNNINVMFDHINRNPFDNRKSNLRETNTLKNSWNRSPMKYTSSKYKGVFWNEGGKNWRSKIMCKGVSYHVGVFKSETEAAKAYNAKASELFGEFAYINIIEELSVEVKQESKI